MDKNKNYVARRSRWQRYRDAHDLIPAFLKDGLAVKLVVGLSFCLSMIVLFYTGIDIQCLISSGVSFLALQIYRRMRGPL